MLYSINVCNKITSFVLQENEAPPAYSNNLTDGSSSTVQYTGTGQSHIQEGAMCTQPPPLVK